MFAKLRIGWQSGSVEQVAQRLDRCLATGRALVQLGRTGEQCCGIGPATWKTALGALCLRQCAFDALDSSILVTVEA